jgi:beta-glucosidase
MDRVISTCKRPKHFTTVLEGIRRRAGAIKVLNHKGSKITVGGFWQQDEVIPSNPEEDRRSIA